MWYHLQSPGGVLLTFVLLHFLWQGILVYCLGRMGAALLPFHTTEARYRWALGTLGGMLLCPLVTFVFLDSRELPPPAVGPIMVQAAPVNLASAGEVSTAWSVGEPHVSYRLLLSLQPYLMLGWLGGVLLLALRLSLGYAGTVWLRRVGLTPVEPQLRFRFVQISDALRLSVVPAVAFSRQVSQAMTVGLLRPMVLLPASWLTQLTPEIVEAVIAHELAHIRRQDLWVNILQRIAETLFFYHPAIWWISAEIRRERELCCDELAIVATGKRLAYARSLEQVAHWHEGRPALLATPFLGSRQDLLLGRVQRVLGMVAPDAPHRFSPACLLLIVAGMSLGVAALTILPTASAQAQSSDEAIPSAALPSELAPRVGSASPPTEAEAPAPSAAEIIADNEVMLLESILDLQEEIRLLQRQVDQLRPIPPGRPPHGGRHGPPHHRPPHGPPPHGPPPHEPPHGPPYREGHRPPPHHHEGHPGHHPGPHHFPPPHSEGW